MFGVRNEIMYLQEGRDWLAEMVQSCPSGSEKRGSFLLGSSWSYWTCFGLDVPVEMESHV